MSYLSIFDWLALAFFLASWFGYGYFADRETESGRSLTHYVHSHRMQWMQQLMLRDNRVTDSALVGNLINSVSFFATTSMYIIAGILALMGTSDQVMSFVAELPLSPGGISKAGWDIKLILMLVIFIYAYFKFTWSLRQFNLLSILIGCAPLPDQLDEHESFARKAAIINTQAGEEFNRGIRAYYFGLAAVAWFVRPSVFVASIALIVYVLYRRDFKSKTLAAMRGDEGKA
ncbi:putative membrane protein [Chitinivorax tropicus]|uniref:Putative membrane protein n=1 Tax=Chitinivorax tropicus TaxID=714531 RepID=A0A840MEX5_9PROT|nr:DUF599 domain-containing protein [Chitinivorax tropicus]MBB5017814.1 putative membrane protein [Chitinivorax tropicus]